MNSHHSKDTRKNIEKEIHDAVESGNLDIVDRYLSQGFYPDYIIGNADLLQRHESREAIGN